MAGLMEGKAGLVTGAARGLGRPRAIRLAPEGAAVVVPDLGRARHGRLDYAHNNAGIGVHKLLADTDDEDFDRVIAVNLRGTFLGMKHQIRQMLSGGGGAIVNTSSNAGLMAVVGLSAYTASKHGILGLTKNAAVEYADD